MLNANFKVERSNLEPCLRTSVHKYSLFKFLDNYNMLKEKYKVLIRLTSSTNQKTPTLRVPAKLANKMPFILAATKCEQLEKCLYNSTLKLVKSRVKNYYCENFFKKLVSIFGNEKAWTEFRITSEWKPKLKFTKIEYKWSEPIVSYFSFMTYKECVRKKRIAKYPYECTSRFLISVYWGSNKEMFRFYQPVQWKEIKSNNKTLLIKQPILWRSLNSISKIKISRILNNPNEKAVRDFRSLLAGLEKNRDLLTEDGIKLQKDLNLARTLL